MDDSATEVVSRWRERAFAVSNQWRGKSLREQREWKPDTDDLIACRIAARKDGCAPDSERAQALAARHVAWLRAIPGTPLADGDRERCIAMIGGLGRMYVEDERFAATYCGPEHATSVRDSLTEYVRWTL
ncbi:TipAS antibiotic-recognition domain-containing protein [Nocardia sp. NPDC004711]